LPTNQKHLKSAPTILRFGFTMVGSSCKQSSVSSSSMQSSQTGSSNS